MLAVDGGTASDKEAMEEEEDDDDMDDVAAKPKVTS